MAMRPSGNAPQEAGEFERQFRRLRREFDDVGITTAGGKDELGDRDGQREASRAGAARVDETNAFALFDKRAVGVTGKHCCESRGCGFETELSEVMNDVEDVGPHLDHIIGRQLDGPWTFVVVTSDGANGGDGSERVQHRGSPDVSAMDDEIRPAKPLDSLGPDQTVGVRDHTDYLPARLVTSDL